MYSSSALNSPPPIVVDWGCSSLRLGLAGDALPRCLVPAVVGVPQSELCCSSSYSRGRGRPLWVGGGSNSGNNVRSGGSSSSVATGSGGSSHTPTSNSSALLCPLNPLQKRDHVAVYPVVVYDAAPLSPAAYARASQHQQQLEYQFAKGKETDARCCNSGNTAEAQKFKLPFLPSTLMQPGCYRIEINGFESLLEAACGPEALDEGSLEGRSVLLSEPNAMDSSLREAYAEMLFESLKCGQGFLCKKAALACFGNARTSSVVVDIGYSHANVAAVQEGFVLQKTLRDVPFAALHFAAFSKAALAHQNYSPITPGFAVVTAPSSPARTSAHAISAATTAAGEMDLQQQQPQLNNSKKSLHHHHHHHHHYQQTPAHSSSLRSNSASMVKHETKDDTASFASSTTEVTKPAGCSEEEEAETDVLIEVAPCPHVSPSYREWACFHLAEVLAQVLGECALSTSSATARACKQHQQRLSAESEAQPRNNRPQVQTGLLQRGSSAGRTTTSSSSSSSSSSSTTTSTATIVTTRRRSSESGGEKQPRSKSSSCRQSSGDCLIGRGEAAAFEDKEQPYVLPDGTVLDDQTVTLIRDFVPESLFNVSLRLRLFQTVLSSSKCAAASSASSSAPLCSGAFGGWGWTSSSSLTSTETAGPGGASAAGTTTTDKLRVLSAVGLMDAVKDCLSSCGRGTARRDVTATILPTGGGSLSPGFLERFKDEVRSVLREPAIEALLSSQHGCHAMNSSSNSNSRSYEAAYAAALQPLRVISSEVDVERHFAAWIGGSIFSCLGSFTDFAVSKEEYEEYGARVAIDRKCS